MRKSFVALLLLLGAAASMTGLAIAQSADDLKGDLGNKLVNSRTAAERNGRAARQSPARVSTSGLDSIWVGHSIQTQVAGTPSTYSFGPWRVGRGANMPTTGVNPVGNSGLWDWDHFVGGESDSLQGWWPMRRIYSITGGLTIPDDQRPWWAVDIGNIGNYTLNNAQGRTRGVISYWHVDGGNKNNPGAFNGNALPAMTWAPLVGNASAWCGLRNHGDFTYIDPLTNNPYNAMVVEMLGENGGGTGSGVGTSKKFPGYVGQMDQMLYTDITLTSSAATLNLTFNYKTRMSTGVSATASTRTGWFQFDPTVVGNVAVAGPNNGIPNYIANTGVGQPADSFMVYIGVPVDIDDVFLADGSHKVPGATPHGVYDLKRRWLSEVLRLDMPIVELFHSAGDANTVQGFTGQALSAFYNAQTLSTKRLRIVFRCKTNRGFDDLGGSVIGAYSSGGEGAVLLDNVIIGGSNVSGGSIGTSGFENTTDIDNGVATDGYVDNGHWRATGKPPAIFHHTHPLGESGPVDIGGGNIYSSLVFQDICGPPTAASRFCNMRGVVISSGDHDNGEAAGGLIAGKPERERMDGIMSPTILLASTGSGDFNATGLDLDDATTTDDYYVFYDIYTGVYNLFFTGNAWWFGFSSYPAAQLDGPANTLGTKCWGEMRVPGFQIFNPDIQCLQDVEAAKGNGLIKTTNSANRPDSIRVYLGKNQQCFRFGVSGSGCSPNGGSYFDNVSFLLSDAGSTGGGGGAIALDIWRWVNDAFPVNDNTSGVPGVAVAPGTAGFDTAAAYIKTGINIAQSPGDANRFDIPGDSTIVIAGQNVHDRVDMVFRVKPGVGNYVTVGSEASGLRKRPDSPTAITATADNFWSSYIANPGDMSEGVHGPGLKWNRNVWNSARIDTADVNIYPVQSNPNVFDVNVNFAATANWMACYHELDPRWNGAPQSWLSSHNRCFLNVPSGAVNSTNIRCDGTIPAGQGYDPATPTTTFESNKIIPDGLLTPGAHVEYFFRLQNADVARDDVNFGMCPDTNVVNPQLDEGSTDGHRWQQFGILPDRWKEALFTYEGDDKPGMACMLYVDLNDRRGNEKAWVSLSDSIGATSTARRGAHNGWRAACNACLTDAVGNPISVGGNPAIARYDHGGQPGSTWDMYGVKASESLTTSAGALGNRLGVQASGLALGKDAKTGPTPDMLRQYYKVLLILTGDLNSGILGKFINRGQNDIALLDDYMSIAAPGTSTTTKRAIYIAGDGFVQSEYATGSGGTFSEHLNMLTNFLATTAKLGPGSVPQYSYQPWSGNFADYVDITTAGPIAGDVHSVGNACLWGNDVNDLVVNTLNGQVSAFYQNFGTHGPYIAGIYTPDQNHGGPANKFYESYVDAWDIEHLFKNEGGGQVSTLGRIGYMFKVFAQIQSATGCTVNGTPLVALDVPSTERFVDFVSNWSNNPLKAGVAKVNFALSRPDRVTVRVYDVSGRLVRTLADRNFDAGPQSLTWDGSDDGGRQVQRGVYFTQVKYARTRFTDAKKLTVLK